MLGGGVGSSEGDMEIPAASLPYLLPLMKKALKGEAVVDLGEKLQETCQFVYPIVEYALTVQEKAEGYKRVCQKYEEGPTDYFEEHAEILKKFSEFKVEASETEGLEKMWQFVKFVVDVHACCDVPFIEDMASSSCILKNFLGMYLVFEKSFCCSFLTYVFSW